MSGLELAWGGPVCGDELTSSTTQERIPNQPGVYLWRRILRRDSAAAATVEGLQRWLVESLAAPVLATDEVQVVGRGADAETSVRARFLRFQSLRIGGAELSPAKMDTLLAHFRDPRSRVDLYAAMSSAQQRFGPVLYVGQTGADLGLRGRLCQHMTAASDFMLRLRRAGLGPSDVAAWYASVGASSDIRELIESLLTHLLLAPMTIRPG